MTACDLTTLADLYELAIACINMLTTPKDAKDNKIPPKVSDMETIVSNTINDEELGNDGPYGRVALVKLLTDLNWEKIQGKWKTNGFNDWERMCREVLDLIPAVDYDFEHTIRVSVQGVLRPDIHTHPRAQQ